MTPPAAPAAPPSGATVVLALHVARGGRGRKHVRPGAPPPPADAPAGRVPRVARMVALAIHYQGLIHDGVARDQAALARLVGISRVRVTQVMDLLRLAPDVQEAVLHLPLVEHGRAPLRERDLWRIAALPLWADQRLAWTEYEEGLPSTCVPRLDGDQSRR